MSDTNAAPDVWAAINSIAEQEKPDMWEWIDDLAEKEKPDKDLGTEPELYLNTPHGLVPASRADRLSLCGVLRHKTNLKTGERFGYYQHCGLAECPVCRAKRADKEKQAVQCYVDGTGRPLKRVELSPEEAKTFTKGLPATCYRRYPQGESVIILHTEPDRAGEEVSPSALDWNKLVFTPKGQNISGKMGKPSTASKKEDVEKGDSKNIRHEAVTLEDTKPDRDIFTMNQAVEEAWELATLATCELSPDLYTVTYCAAARMAKFKEFLTVAGISVKFSVYAWEKVYECEVNWTSYNEHIRKKYAKRGVINPNMLGTTLAENKQHLPDLAAVDHWDQGKDWKKGDDDFGNCPFMD